MPMNNTTGLPPVWVQHATWTYAWYVIHLTISQAGGVGHLLVMTVLLVDKRLRVGSGGLVLHLVLTEYLVCGVWMPMAAIASDWGQKGKLTLEPLCPLLQLGLLASSQAGYWTSFFLAVNRFMAAKLPHLYPSLTPRPVILLMIAISWTIGLTTTTPLLAHHGGDLTVLPPWRSCGIRVTSVPVRTTAQAFGVYIPFAGSVVLYAISVLLMQRQKRRVGVDPPGVSRKVQERRLIIAQMLLVSTLVHGVSYVPGVLLSSQFRHVSVMYPLVDLWTRTLFLSAYASQPVVFFLLNKEYQRTLRLLSRRFCNRAANRESNSMRMSMIITQNPS